MSFLCMGYATEFMYVKFTYVEIYTSETHYLVGLEVPFSYTYMFNG